MPFLRLVKIKIPSKYRKGLSDYRAGRWEVAAEYFRAAILQQPQHADSHFKLGMCHFRLGQFEQAVSQIGRALTISPERVEWEKQLSQAERNAARGVSGKNDSNDGATTLRSPKAAGVGSEEKLSIQLLQSLLLHGAYLQFREVVSLYRSHLGREVLIKAGVGALQCEQGLMMRQVGEVESGLELLTEGTVPRFYYQARLFMQQGRHGSAIKELQLCRNQKSGNAEVDYALAECFFQLGDRDAGRQALEAVLFKSRRAATWDYLAREVHDLSSLNHYLELLDRWVSEKPMSRYHLDVSAAAARAALSGGNGKLARKIWHDCVLAHEQRKGGPRSVIPETLRFSQASGLPQWLGGYADLPYDSVMNVSARARVAARDFTDLVNQADLNAFFVNESRIWIEGRCDAPRDVGPLDVLALDERSREGLESASSPFKRQSSDSEATYLAHANGIVLRVLVACRSDQGLSVIDHGVLWSIDEPALTSLSNDRADTEHVGYGSYASSVDMLRAIREEAIINGDKLGCLGYQYLLTALINGHTALESAAMHVLRLIGEGAQDYQRLLKGHFVIPDLEVLKNDAPEVVLHVSGLENVGYQANMWIPILERLDAKCAIVIREKHIASELIPTSLPVYLIRNLRNLELIEEAGVKTILYPANPQKNAQALRLHRLNHFFINHGESDKVVNQSKFLMAYDQLLVAGPLAERRLKASGLPIRDNQITHVGRPQVELSLKRVDHPAANIKKILYAPTWEGFVEEANYSSVGPQGLELVKRLAKRSDVYLYFKPHPYTGYNKSGDTGAYLKDVRDIVDSAPNMEYVGFDQNIHDYMNRSDLLVTDISSVLNDYLYTLKPIVLAGTGNVTIESLMDQYPSSRAAYVLGEGDFEALLASIIKDDALFETRKEVCRDSLGEFEEGSFSTFNRCINKSLVSNV